MIFNNQKIFQFLVVFLFAALCREASFVDANDIGADPQNEDQAQVCVTLEQFGNGCSGSLKGTNTFTALTKPGSPCKHTSNMKNNSAKDQYCDEHGVFHQTVFIHNKHCKVGWAEKAFSPMKLTYTQHDCTYGYKLKSCVPGPCSEEGGSLIEEKQGTPFVRGDATEVFSNEIGQLRGNKFNQDAFG